MATKLLYLERADQYTCQAQVVDIISEEGKTIVILDQTIFYPQGGGQPYDLGNIVAEDGKKFIVQEVRFVNGIVRHIGTFEAESFSPKTSVICNLDIERRKLNSRLHSAGHLIDMAFKRMGVNWIPTKGYHFSNGSYVEYIGNLSGNDINKLKADLEENCNKLVAENIPVKIFFATKEEMKSLCDFVPDYIPEGKPGRVVMFGNFGIPCGGTHVSNLSETGKIIIRKIKQDGENIRVSYALE